MDCDGRACDGLSWAKSRVDAVSSFGFGENIEISFENEEYLLDLVRVCGIALSRFDVHDAQREAAGRDRLRVAVLARAAGADETMLCALVAFNFGILESI